MGTSSFVDAQEPSKKNKTDNDIHEYIGNDRSTNIGRNDSFYICESQFVKIGNNIVEQVEHKLQVQKKHSYRDQRPVVGIYNDASHERWKRDGSQFWRQD